jgi:hypothetical protein
MLLLLLLLLLLSVWQATLAAWQLRALGSLLWLLLCRTRACRASGPPRD